MLTVIAPAVRWMVEMGRYTEIGRNTTMPPLPPHAWRRGKKKTSGIKNRMYARKKMSLTIACSCIGAGCCLGRFDFGVDCRKREAKFLVNLTAMHKAISGLFQ